MELYNALIQTRLTTSKTKGRAWFQLSVFEVERDPKKREKYALQMEIFVAIPIPVKRLSSSAILLSNNK